jgi:hypothetical protein
MEPEDPELVVPELNVRTPLTPPVPALAVLIVIAPLVVAPPWPLVIPTAPPVVIVLSPAARVIKPPTPLFPVPTVMLTAPPVPLVAVPDPIAIEPEFPTLVEPELKVSSPLTPELPPLAVWMVIAPLEVAKPRPLVTPMEPPVAAVL